MSEIYNICPHRIRIGDKHIKARRLLTIDNMDNIKKKTFRSFDIKHVERQVNEFLEDAIYIQAIHNSFYYDTSDIPEFSDKTDPLYNHVVIVYYVDWPF